MILRLAGAVLCGVFLFASFSPLEWAPVAWFALVPLLIISAHSTPAASFKWGLVSGLVFWLMSIWWITRVSCLGWVCLCAYCALFIACFAMTVSWWIRNRVIQQYTGNPVLVLTVPAVWAGFEFLRSTLISGFPWNPLGVSQFNNLALIQCAEWGGVYLVSYVIVLVNIALALTLVLYFRPKGLKRYRAHPELMISIVILGLSFWYGNGAVRRFSSSSGTMKIAAIQPNISQVDKWSEDQIAEIYARLQRATESAISRFNPDLIVWPETAMPDFVMASGPSQKVVLELLTNGVPILIGSMDSDDTGEGIRYYNSSFLFTAKGYPAQSYAKRHLVLFGEYIPMEGFIPFIRCLSPIEGSFTPGTTNTVFRLGPERWPFSVLICFEDTVASLARESVRNGARLLINQTNDAWFDPSCASRQQMAHCVFRCVENRVAAVRATNTGVTCFIDRNGVVYGLLAPAYGRSPKPSYTAQAVFIPNADMPLTFYTKYGDMFAIICLTVTLPLFAAAIITRKRRSSKNHELRTKN